MFLGSEPAVLDFLVTYEIVHGDDAMSKVAIG